MRLKSSVFTRLLLTLSTIMGIGVTFAAEIRPPNMVFILADDIAWNDYGFAGNTHVRTPNLDRLAKESRAFLRGYVPSSLCRPSLMSMITGLYPHQHLVTGNDPPQGTPREAMLKHVDRLSTIPKLLAKQGYDSFQSGKWWEGNYVRGGFTHGMTLGDPTKGGRHGDAGLKIGREGMQPVFDFIDSHTEKPFFLWYAPMLPHQPHNPPERLLQKYREKTPSLHVAKYWAMIEWFDETCGQLLDHLDEKKLGDNTIVVYCADNGWIQNPEKPTFDPRSKRSRFDAGLRTPLLFRWRGKITPILDNETLVSTIDIAPTLLAAAGSQKPPEMPGVNLLPLSKDSQPLSRDTLYGAIFEHDIPDIDHAEPGLQYRWILSRHYKLIVPAEGQPVELFDVLADPEEQKNMATEQPNFVIELRTQLDAWWKVEAPVVGAAIPPVNE